VSPTRFSELDPGDSPSIPLFHWHRIRHAGTHL